MVNRRLIALAQERGSDTLPEETKPGTTVAAREPRVKNLEDFLVLENIVCKDSENKVIETYPKIRVKKDLEKKEKTDEKGKKNTTILNLTPYQAITHFEQQNLFLPSFALSCNILSELYNHRNDAEISKVLMQYKDYGSGWGWHAQNTVIDWAGRKIIHYSKKEDFIIAGGNKDINKSMVRKEYLFNPESFDDMLLEDALKDDEFKKFLVNLTGLQNPEILIEIGEYFGKPARVWVPNNPAKASYTSAA